MMLSSIRKYATVMICHRVLCFPSFSDGSTIPRLVASNRSPVIRNSRLMRMIAIEAGIARRGIRVMNPAAIITLSASGSINLPKFVTSLCLRAR